MKERTIKNLFINGIEKVYFYLSTDDIKKKFIEDAAQEGYRYAAGSNVADIKAETIMSADTNGKICFVGINGHMIMSAKQKNNAVLRVDYKKYIENKVDYLYKI